MKTKKLYRSTASLIRKHKKKLLFFPVYLLYILFVYLILGAGEDIWDRAVKRMEG